MGRVFFIFNQKMSAFEDEFEAVPPVSEIDPAAEFLAKEQEELGDIGEDLGLGAPQDFPAAVDENFGGNIEDENALFSASQSQNSGLIPVENANDADVNPFLQDPIQMQETPAPVVMEGKDIYAGMQNLSIKKDQEEPEFITKWKEEQQERLRKKERKKSWRTGINDMRVSWRKPSPATEKRRPSMRAMNSMESNRERNGRGWQNIATLVPRHLVTPRMSQE